MTPHSPLIGVFCRLYSVFLYAYPRDFRREYGAAMRQVFRDRCREVARAPGRLSKLHFALTLAADWLITSLRERASDLWSAGRRKTPRSFVTEWAVTIAIYLFATTTLVQAYVIPTASMENTVLVGDHMLVDRATYSKPAPGASHILPYRDPARGDVVVFLYPEDIRETYIKRVIGVPGDRIHLDNKQVIRNGKRLIEPYTQHIAVYSDPYRDNFPLTVQPETTPRGRDMFARYVRNGEVVVPPDALFVMGDNRENSEDSRYWGFVPRSYVVGKPLFIYWSYDAPTADLKDWSVDHMVDVIEHFFTRTRWERTFTVPRSQAAREVGDTQ
jgi:signal peptidase I